MDTLRSLLHTIGDTLLWPVLIGLVGLGGWTCIAMGRFLHDWYHRRSGEPLTVTRFRTWLQAAPRSPADVMKHLQEANDDGFHRAATVRRAVRLGPALGLMGTLIPMAGALQGLSSGNFPEMAGNLVTAFSATVLGLAISVVAFVISSVREHWAQNDARERAWLADTHAPSAPTSERAS